MPEFHTFPTGDAGVIRYEIRTAGEPLSFAAVLRALRDEAEFREFFAAGLAAVPFAAFRWETPGLTAESSHIPFECVILDSPGLAEIPDPEPFAEHFVSPPADGIVTFTNLRADATLIVPVPLGPLDSYAHLASFVRTAPTAQRQALWQTVGRTVLSRLGPRPLWLSTAGAGVSWLHVRLDDRPKYYHHTPYRTPPRS